MSLLCGYLLAGFAGMEIISYLSHRFLFHGILWKIHQTHHSAGHKWFELNDLFTVIFASISIYLLVTGSSSPTQHWHFGTGLGIALYGILYFIIHDLYTHKRFFPFKSNSRLMRLIKKAHQNHHQSSGKKGNEPYGLFLFPYKNYEDRI